jgi:FixJ family two-component response regulator
MPRKPARPLVCVIDDDQSVREALPDLLREFGFDAVAFASARAFLSSRELDEAACLVLDVAMPGMDGPQLQVELQRRGHRIPTVFISAHSDAPLTPFLAACLRKPFTDQALLEEVMRALGRE